ELQSALRAGISTALSQRTTVRYQGLKFRAARQIEMIDVRVEPIAAPPTARRLALVIFEQHRPASRPRLRRKVRSRPSPSALTKDRRILDLERALHFTHAELQQTIVYLEAANQELAASNQDLMSINEEFQMTNEELESSREELHFLNEELTSLNAKLQKNVDELVQLNNDMHNLLSSSRVATLFLDRSLRVQRFTPAMSEIVPLIQADIGRPFQDVSATFEYANFACDAERVLAESCTLEHEIVNRDRHYSIRMHPYQTTGGATDGVVITFFDTSSLKRAESALHQSQKMQALGTLAGGIAHDFNNVLTAILGNVEFGKTDLPADHEAQQNFSEIERAALRASDLVRRILTFSRKREADRLAIELQPLVEEALKLLRATLPAMIEIRTDFASDVPKILADT
ncbi:MAG TPA: PAS domain-containing protein, partial [Roseiflexaceae bacterium]|nr:PAS domain-containing protein [Roseiflexaceae bacterium]